MLNFMWTVSLRVYAQTNKNVQFYPSKQWFKPTNQPVPYYYIAYYCFFDYSRESRWHTETLSKKLKIYDN